MSMTCRDKHYSDLFSTFVRLSGEKQFLLQRIQALLPDRKTNYLDVGAGNGDLTRTLSPFFTHTSAVEANREFLPRLREIADQVFEGRIEDLNLTQRFDFILACHMLGYIPPRARASVVTHLFSHLEEQGILVFIYNSPNSQVYRILRTLAPLTGRCWAEPVSIHNPAELLYGKAGYAALTRESMTVRAATEKEASDTIEFFAFGDRPLEGEGRAALSRLVDSYRVNEHTWEISIEHEFLCFCASKDVLSNRPFFAASDIYECR